MIGLIQHSPARRALLSLTALVFAGLALQTLARPDLVAAAVGNGLHSANDYSELHAIYAGLWLGHTALGLLAARHVDSQPLLGDVLGLLIFSQALGRVMSAAQWGWPDGVLRVMMAVEIISGLTLWLVRPSQGVQPIQSK
ncbi:MAG: DUF4345 domain-containing protein [Aquabacterium sp.]|uniref:DUF4345 family protein n=1 Tax=Aquabacterium sp. TaxID=1872578 RepID=UPI001214BBB6|nr:DUF4345 family protein [Aquabacterium sp.]TAK93110.1 MAG: DUF4345 domain-containing protein [Aquabacterium sp.]